MRWRTINAAYSEIVSVDPNTGITKYRLKQMIINGEIPHRKSGKKYLVNMDDIDKYFSGSVKYS